MAQRVFMHVGIPKTGTTFLQTLMWRNRRALRRAGLLVPGTRRADHFYGSLVVREDPNISSRNEHAPTAWARILDQVRRWDGDAVISHEFYGAASAAQTASAIEDLAPAHVHIVGTVRNLVDAFPSFWAESVKFGGTRSLAEFCAAPDDDPARVWGWRTMDAPAVLERWTGEQDALRTHVVVYPSSGSDPRELWRRFARVMDVDDSVCDTARSTPNASLGVTEAELLRRVNAHLGPGSRYRVEAGRWIRGYLSQQVLVPHGGMPVVPADDVRGLLVERQQRAVESITAAGYDVVGSLGDLTKTSDSTPRDPSDVSSDDMLDVATESIARLLYDLRQVTGERDALQGQPDRASHV